MSHSTSTFPDQPLLFDIAPEGAEIPIAQRVITPGCLLPAPEHLFVDNKRAAQILGVAKNSITFMLRQGVLRGYQLSGSMRWNVLYESIVQLCDDLRIRHHIRDRRTRTLRPGQRWRDAELLPFPLSDTVHVNDVMVALSCGRQVVVNLCEEGAFECYRLYESAHWRISKISLYAFAEDRARQLAGKRKGNSR